jgi:hypothetical protein
MSRQLPIVSGGVLFDPAAPATSLRLDSPTWLVWLEAPTTRHFTYPLDDRRHGYVVGFMTVRKEGRQRGTAYWTVYRRAGARLRKVYLGRSADVTAARLEAIAQAFLMALPAGKEEPPMDPD